MALNQEEIRIRAGLDYSRVTAGITDIRSQVFRLANDVPKKLFSLLKANVFIGAATLISEVLPSWQEIWDKIYNTGPEALARAEESNQNIKALAKAMLDSKKQLEKAMSDSSFSGARKLDQEAILESELDAQRREVQQAKDRLQLLQATKQPFEERSKAQKIYNDLLTAQIKLEDKLAAVRKTFTDSDRFTSDARHQAERNQSIFARRTEIKNIQGEMDFNAEEANWDEYSKLKKQRDKIMMSIREDTFQQVKGTIASLPDISIGGGSLFGGIKSAVGGMNTLQGVAGQMQAAQKAAMQEVFNSMAINVVITGITEK